MPTICDMTSPPPAKGEERFTVYFHYGIGIEEVDVNARSEAEAICAAATWAESNLEPWLKITCSIPRVGLYT